MKNWLWKNKQNKLMKNKKKKRSKSAMLRKEETRLTALLGSSADTGAQTCQTDALSVTNEAVMDSLPAAFQSVESTIDSVGGTNALSVTNETVMDLVPSPFQSAEATANSVGGNTSSHYGWLSSESESDSEKVGDDDGDGDDDDDEMIQLTPEPLCEELENLLADVRHGERKRKRPTRWDN